MDGPEVDVDLPSEALVLSFGLGEPADKLFQHCKNVINC